MAFICWGKRKNEITMKAKLESYTVNLRVKLSALWTSVMFCYIYTDYFELYVPGKVDGLLNGQNMLNSPIKLFTANFVLLVPALMIFLSLMLSPKLTKWLNIGVGLFFTLFTLLVGVSSISAWRMFYVFSSLLESMLTIIIVWQAFSWKKINAN
jgi:hypothetical protein